MGASTAPSTAIHGSLHGTLHGTLHCHSLPVSRSTQLLRGVVLRRCRQQRRAGVQVAVGVGTLAGSTIMLLTVAWGGSVLAGRCDLNAQVRTRQGHAAALG